MNKRTKLIISFLLVISLCLWEKTPTNIFADETKNTKLDENLVRNMYCGYDVTAGKNIMNPDALKRSQPIIDPESNYKNHITPQYGGMTQNKTIISSSIKTENSEYANHISNGVFGNIFVINVDMDASFAKSDKLSKISSERYEIYSMYKEYCRYYLEGVRDEDYKNYLSTNFKEDLYKVNSRSLAKQLFDKYGTHLITGYIFGGRMDVTNYMATSSEEHDLRNAKSFSEKMGGFISKVSAGEKVSFQEEVASVETDSETISEFDLRAYGGEGGSMATVSDMFTYSNVIVDNGNGNNSNAARYNYQRWTDSIDRGVNLTIVGIPDNGNAKAIPLWDLLDYNDSRSIEIRELLIDEFIERCGDGYSKYLEKYASQAVSNQRREEINFGFPVMNGVYIRTPNDYFYYVDAEDLVRGKEHNEVHKGDKVYLDLENVFEDNIEVSCQNGKPIDERAGVFEVKDVSGNFAVVVKNSKGEKHTYIDVPIQNTVFEGGMGTEKYPYIIVNKDQFGKIMNQNYSSFQLQADIDFGGEKLTSFGEFGGTLDGNFCKIKNFIIEAGKDYGLFSKLTKDATVKNLGIFNAGTSTNSSQFSAGGLNYGEDYEKDTYTVNSIEALNAGIICGVNDGVISNCYVQDCYIRDIIKNNDSYEDTLHNINICIGGIAGKNNGEISSCMVNNSQLLGSYIYTKDDKNSNIYVYSGTLVGELCSGTVQSCVADQGTNGTVMSQIINEYSGSLWDPDVTAKAYSTGFIGYCDGTAVIKNSYCYVRNIHNNNLYPAVASEFHSTDMNLNAEVHQAYANATIICGDNFNATVTNSYAYSDDENLQIVGIRPTENCKKSTDQEEYSSLLIFEKRKIENTGAFDSIGLDKASYDYDTANNAFSRIKHILTKNRSDFIEISLDESGDDFLLTDVYSGSIYRLHGIKLKKSINKEKNEDISIFNVKVVDVKINVDNDKYRNMTDRKLFSTDPNKYQLVFSIYGGEINDKNYTYLKVREKNLVDIKVVSDDLGSTHMYYDEVEDYFNTWSADKINIIKVMTDGTSEPVGKYEQSKISLTNKYDEIGIGENTIQVEYNDGTERYTSSYVINVEERKLVSVELSEPVKKEYRVGEVFDVSGMTMTLKYDKGNPDTKVIKLDKDDKNIEIINGTIVKGENKIAVTYKDYKTVGYVTVTGKDDGIFTPTPDPTETPTTDSNGTPTPEPIETPTPEPTSVPTPTPLIEPIPTPINPGVIAGLVCFIFAAVGVVVYIIKKKKEKISSNSDTNVNDNSDNDKDVEDGDE